MPAAAKAPAKAAADTREVFLGKYQALHLLGEGGMGQVFYGRDMTTNQEVVIKVMHDHLANVPSIRQSFERELRLMMRFHHANSVQLIDGALDGPGRPCLVMEFIDGIDLERHIEKHGRFSVRQVGWWLGQLCSVLHAAHYSNILHRDLTLNNLMLIGADTDDEIIKVMDFGLARLTTAYFIPFEKLTGTNIGGGTPDYVAPEQVRGEQVDHRADLYSVGVVLYKLLTGWLPFQEYTEVNDILDAHRLRTPPTFADRGVTDVPAEIEAIVRQLLSKMPSERPSSAKDLGLRFEKALHERIFPEGAWDFDPLSGVVELPRFDPKYCLDTMEAFMPEQIAIMKLRAFADSVGGEIAESEPGRIRVRMLDPRRKKKDVSGDSGLFGIFRRKALPDTKNFLHLDLFMEKHDQGARSTVEIAVVMAPEKFDTREEADMRAGFGQRICRELRAYLMIGR